MKESRRSRDLSSLTQTSLFTWRTARQRRLTTSCLRIHNETRAAHPSGRTGRSPSSSMHVSRKASVLRVCVCGHRHPVRLLHDKRCCRLPAVSGETQSIIQQAMDHWEAETCLTFRSKEESDEYWILFRSDSTGCYSFIGRDETCRGQGQPVSISHGCEQVCLPLLLSSCLSSPDPDSLRLPLRHRRR